MGSKPLTSRALPQQWIAKDEEGPLRRWNVHGHQRQLANLAHACNAAREREGDQSNLTMRMTGTNFYLTLWNGSAALVALHTSGKSK